MLKYRQLMTAVLAGDAPDASPVSAWKHAPVADQEADTLAAAALAFQARHDFDFAKLTPASTWQSRDHGLDDRLAGDAIGRREVVTTVIAAPDDWRRLTILDPWSGFSGRMLAAARLARRGLAPEVPLLVTVFNPLFQASQLAGWARLRRHLADHPEAVNQGLATLRANTLAVINAFEAEGAEGVFFVTQHACHAFMEAGAYADAALADDRACLAAAASMPFSMAHIHGEAAHVDLFADQPWAMLHYDSVPSNPAPLEVMKAAARGLATGPSPGRSLRASKASLADGVRDLRGAMAGGRFFVTPGCALPLATADQDIDAMARAAKAPLGRRPDDAAA